MFLLTPDLVPPASTMDLEVRWPDGGARFSSLQAKVCFCGETRHGHGAGVHLAALSGPERERWERSFRAALATYTSRLATPKACIVSVRGALSRALRTLLVKEGEYVVLDVADRGEALDVLGKVPVAVLLCDANASGNDGLALCKRLRADSNARQSGVILLVDGDSPTEFTTCLRAGADYAVVKPYDERLVLSRMNHLVRQRFAALDEIADNLDTAPDSLGAIPDKRVDPEDDPVSSEPRRGSFGWRIHPLHAPGPQPTLVQAAAEKAADLWLTTRLYLKEQWRASR
jgi:CheY-like chemotaxis protein